MNALERLRIYLEQRRELGETELVLDSLPVETVMQIVGAARDPEGGAITESPRRERRDVPLPVTASQAVIESALGSGYDGVRTGEGRSGEGRSGEGRSGEGRSGEGRSGEGRSGSTPPAGSTDWREHLRPSASDVNAPASAIGGDAAGGKSALAVPGWLGSLGVPIGIRVGAEPLHAWVTRLDREIAALPTLEAVADSIARCTRCGLSRTAINPVPGEGSATSGFVCVGEAPGQAEDEQGRPFVGPAGQLLTKILAAIDFKREDVFICNVLKHRPPGNRNPRPEEVRACLPYLVRQLELLKPRVILALGSFAASALLDSNQPLGRLRGQVHLYHGIPLIVTYHPAALLRNEAWKRPAWEDVKLARRVYDASSDR